MSTMSTQSKYFKLKRIQYSNSNHFNKILKFGTKCYHQINCFQSEFVIAIFRIHDTCDISEKPTVTE